MKYLINTLTLLLTVLNMNAQERVCYFKETKNGKYALFNKETNQQITKAIYTDGRCLEDICRVNKGNLVGFIDYQGNEIVPAIYEGANAPAEGRIPMFNGSHWGCMDYEGNIKVPFEFSSIRYYSDGLAPATKDTGTQPKYGFIDKEGKFLINPQFDRAKNFYNGFAAVAINNQWTFIDAKGTPLTKFKYAFVKDFSNGLAVVGVYVDPDKEVPEMRIVDGHVTGGIKETYEGVINTKGKEVLPTVFSSVSISLENNYIKVSKDRKEGLYNVKGKVLVPMGKYDSIGNKELEVDLIEVTHKSLTGYVNLKGKEIIPPAYKFNSSFIDDLVYVNKPRSQKEIKKLLKQNRVVRSEAAGVIHSSGKVVVPCIYDDVRPLENGFFKVKNLERTGFLNSKGKEVIPLIYGYASNMSKNGFAIVQNHSSREYFCIDSTGKIVSKPKYDIIDPFIFDDLIAVRKNGKWGYINAKDEIVVEIKYDGASRYANGVALVRIGKKRVYINTRGETVTPNKSQLTEQHTDLYHFHLDPSLSQ